MIKFKFISFLPDGTRRYCLGAAKTMEAPSGVIMFREDGPAEILPDGTQVYYMNSYKGREDGPAVIGPSGYQEYWNNGKLGRLNGPAIIYSDGGQDWILQGLYHRADGPARIFANGMKEYFHHGRKIPAQTDNEFMRKVRLINLM